MLGLGQMDSIHINRSKGAMGDRTADRAGKGEARVQVKALRLLLGSDLGDDRRRCSHCDGKE